MSRRNMKSYNKYHEAAFKAENAPEEGEIVDDYDLIVSSDEELSMRQRIRELEAENEEIEQIAVISRSYVDKINPPLTHLETSRAAQVPTDVSSISSTEFVTPKKRKRRKSREHKRKHCHHQHHHQHHHHQHEHERHDQQQQQQQIPQKSRSKKTHCKRRQKLFAKKCHKIHSERYSQKEINTEYVSLETTESSDSSVSLTDSDNYGKNSLPRRKQDLYDYGKYITRDTLRLAVARNSKETMFVAKKSCLKDKLLRQELGGHSSNIALGEFVDNQNNNAVEDDDDDDDVQVIENEPDIQTIDEDSTDSMEEKELRLIALKSAVLRKHMARKMRNAESAYSPTDFDDMLSSGVLQQDTKLDDLEVDLDAEDSQNPCITASPVASPQLMILDDQEESQQMVDCKPIDMDIANSDSDETTIGSWTKEVEPVLPTFSLVSQDFSHRFNYGFYMPELHELPPPPPGVDDYEDAPPPPPYHKVYNAEMQDMELDNEELTVQQNLLEMSENCSRESQYTNDNERVRVKEENKAEEEEEEEEEALRALLLSKFQSPKNQTKSKRPKEICKNPETINTNELDCKPEKPTEFILKEAVKRLKIHSQTELPKEDSSNDGKQNSKSNSSTQLQEISENKNNSLTLLEKLRNRLNIYNNKQQKIEEIREIGEENDDKGEDKDKEIVAYSCDPTENIVDMNNMAEYDEYNADNFSNCTEVRNKIDISDITRRLQQIKENVLNSMKKQKAPETTMNLDTAQSSNEISQQSNECFKVRESIPEDFQPLLEEPSNHNLDNNIHINENFSHCNEILNKEKTILSDFDIATKQTTFKVTICNSEALKAEDKPVNDSNKDISSKENKANNVTNNIKLKVNVNVNSKNKSTLNSERMVKIINKAAESKDSIIKSASLDVLKTSSTAPTYAVIRPTTKIVKPNKVINTNFDLKRRQINQLKAKETSSQVAKPSRNETANQLAKTAENSRLITSMDQVKHMYNIAPMIISVQNSSNESSADEGGNDYDTLYKPLYDYNDNASPLSLNLESPSRTPLRSNSPTIETNVVENTKIKELDTKINEFLKKTKISTPQIKIANMSEKLKKTPLAVRHLPAAAQSEYRRLVHRMKLLENKRKTANNEDNKNEQKTEDGGLPVTEEQNKSSLVKKVLIRNANNNNTATVATENQPSNGSNSNTSPKFHKTNVLRSYENLYVKFGAGIVNNLDKSLKLVEEAKKAKITKLKLENRLKELKAEMDLVQSKHKEEQQKISLIYPSICSTNEVITSLKQKRSKVFKAAINLGKTLKGEEYRLNNDLKKSITCKSKQLALEIKLVNSLKAQDIVNMEKTLKPSTSNNQTDNNLKPIEENNTKSNRRETNENVLCDNTLQVESETIEARDEDNKNVLTLQTHDDGGNTEFQKLENHNTPTSPEEKAESKTQEKVTKAIPQDGKNSLQTLPSYISPLEHLRNIDSNVDPHGVICPYDLMGNCEDVTCKYVHITPKAKT